VAIRAHYDEVGLEPPRLRDQRHADIVVAHPDPIQVGIDAMMLEVLDRIGPQNGPRFHWKARHRRSIALF